MNKEIYIESHDNTCPLVKNVALRTIMEFKFFSLAQHHFLQYFDRFTLRLLANI